MLTQPYEPLAADAQATKAGTAATVVGNSAENGGTIEWATPANANVSDNAYATATMPVGSISLGLKMTNWAFPIPEGATITGVSFDVESKAGNPSKIASALNLVKAGAMFGVAAPPYLGYWGTTDEHQIYGGSSYLPVPLTPADVNSELFGVFIQVYSSATGTGSTTASIDSVAITVYYTEAESEDRICFATRSMELRSNGVDRQARKDDVWGGLVPDGFFPTAIPSGQEARPTRVIIIASQGDLGTLADAGSNKLSAVVNVRSGHHSVRDASP